MSSVCEDLEYIQHQMLANVIAKMRKQAKSKKEKLVAVQLCFLLEKRSSQCSGGHLCLKSNTR